MDINNKTNKYGKPHQSWTESDRDPCPDYPAYPLRVNRIASAFARLLDSRFCVDGIVSGNNSDTKMYAEKLHSAQGAHVRLNQKKMENELCDSWMKMQFLSVLLFIESQFIRICIVQFPFLIVFLLWSVRTKRFITTQYYAHCNAFDHCALDTPTRRLHGSIWFLFFFFDWESTDTCDQLRTGQLGQ